MTSSLAVIGRVRQLKAIRKRRRPTKPKAAPEPPKLSDHWQPNEGPQAEFFHSTCHEVLYGGEAGGGKSAALTALPLKWAHIDGFSALTIRREYKQTKQLRKYSRTLYRKVYPGLEPVKSEGYTWHFPSGAEASYGHCEHEDDYQKYDGEEIHLLCLDELTHFTRTQYLALSARVRTSDPRCPTYIRCTTNPGGPGHDWVFTRWGAWLDPKFEAPGLEPRFAADGERLPPALPGEVWYICTLEDGSETYHREEVPGSLSRCFIPAGTRDNPYISEAYRLQLNQLDAVRRAQLRDGNWLIKPAAGLYFKRDWIVEVVDRDKLPKGIRWVRYWDLAATAPKKGNTDPDWTRGVLMGILGEDIYVADVASKRDNPGAIETFIKATAALDGKAVPIGLPQDPGQAGKSQAAQYVKALAGYTVLIEVESGDKAVRFGPFSTQAEHRHVRLVKGAWNNDYVAELEAFPTPGIHDDQVDATSGAYSRLLSGAGRFLAAMAAYAERNPSP
jgi:predicted phage terminase large subunit-like protein